MDHDLRYPIGNFNYPGTPAPEERARWIQIIDATPAALRTAVEGLAEAQLETPYRSGGWTVRQTVHHVADSHVNSYVRFRLALTETEPTIKPYEEQLWAELADAKSMPVEVSLTMLDAIHARWVVLLRSLTEEQWTRTFRHPALGLVTLDKNLALYAWHGPHHVAHIAALRERMGW